MIWFTKVIDMNSQFSCKTGPGSYNVLDAHNLESLVTILVNIFVSMKLSDFYI